ncbi:hypothetical protein FB445_1143 [Vibrio crassostreae]|uniref:hypothetical protein n=1 Tax=Vibrio crassostreae TaxID=246167 RepID=UPI00119A8AF0|nr:hypothetical protein [Vibrio crassostreae]TWD65807.1 hypothetical protein FB445_1143 [Vibrio crassostreae]
MGKISWALTQHAKVINDDFQKFAELAYKYRGRKEFSDELNKDIINEGILTENDRDGKSSPWRDYQQVLPTLGCVISTKTEPSLTFTQIGSLAAKGEINFSEFITIQALRLQYPNGNTLSNGIYESQLKVGLSVKPGLLVLETLLELEVSKENVTATLSTDECQHFLVPHLNNDLNLEPLIEAKKIRGSGFKATRNASTRRNVQDWFQLLANTLLFDVAKRTSSKGGASELKLSKLAKENLEQIKLLVNGLKAEGYWKPENHTLEKGKPEKAVRLDWFNYYGSLPNQDLYSLWLPKLEIRDDLDDDISPDMRISEPAAIRFVEVEDSITSYKGSYTGSSIGKSGIESRLKASAKHEKMILTLDAYFKSNGFTTRADPDSVDIYAYNDKKTFLIEAKTTNLKNFSKQVRQAIGQLFEYRFRLDVDASLIIAISTTLDEESFYVRFLNEMGISVVVVQGEIIQFYWAEGAAFA